MELWGESRDGSRQRIPRKGKGVLIECMNDPEERAEIVRFAWMWMSLAEPIDEARGSYEFPRGRW